MNVLLGKLAENSNYQHSTPPKFELPFLEKHFCYFRFNPDQNNHQYKSYQTVNPFRGKPMIISKVSGVQAL